MYYWITFSDGSAGSVTAKTVEAAKVVGFELKKLEVTNCQTLPYPARPQLHETGCPSFCNSPSRCAGGNSCPKRPSCVD